MTAFLENEPQPIHRAWTYCPRCGAAAVACGVNPFRCSTCEYVHFFSPCAAVGAITTDAAGRVLLLIRGRDPGKGMYGLPGGFVDPGESAEAALHREVREETGLTVSSHRYLTSFPNQYAFGGALIPVTDLFFMVTVDSFQGMVMQAGEIDGHHFCFPAAKELARMAFHSNRQALELFLQQQQSSRQSGTTGSRMGAGAAER